jgi:hypothetical protein
MKKKSLKIDLNEIEKDYSYIMKDSNFPVKLDKQWSNDGDNFKKYSLYDDQPTQTSISSTLLSEISPGQY